MSAPRGCRPFRHAPTAARGIQNCVIGLANVIVQSQINSFGMLAMAAYGAHCKIEGFAFLPITSFTMACTTFVGQNLGAKQYDRAKRGARFCIIIAVVMAELIGLCYYIWASQLISLFDSTPGEAAHTAAGIAALGSAEQGGGEGLFACGVALKREGEVCFLVGQQRAVKGDAVFFKKRAELLDAALVRVALLGAAAEQQKEQKCVDEQQNDDDDIFEPRGFHVRASFPRYFFCWGG